ncbi:hypothetical protein NHP164001_03330 [Helicobacter trogontum]|uniref:Uncharacterized protein n=1 Tax=Helicobacter trogontum TaxID=50960 RepID=A0ABQ0D1W2_9HELI
MPVEYNSDDFKSLSYLYLYSLISRHIVILDKYEQVIIQIELILFSYNSEYAAFKLLI